MVGLVGGGSCIVRLPHASVIVVCLVGLITPTGFCGHEPRRFRPFDLGRFGPLAGGAVGSVGGFMRRRLKNCAAVIFMSRRREDLLVLLLGGFVVGFRSGSGARISVLISLFFAM